MKGEKNNFFNSDKTVMTTVVMLLIAIGLVALLMAIIGDGSKEPEAYGDIGPIKLDTRTAFSPFAVAKQPDENKADEVAVKKSLIQVKQDDIPAVDTPKPLDADAIASFALSVEVDDPRSPPINRTQPEPTVAQDVLDDPVKYAEYEAQNRRVLLQNYVVAAKAKVDKLNQLIALGRAKGISPEKLQEGLSKVAALEAGIAEVSQEL